MEETFKQKLEKAEDKSEIYNEWVENQILEEHKRKLVEQIRFMQKQELQQLEQKHQAYFDELNDVRVKYRNVLQDLDDNKISDVEDFLDSED